MAEGAELIFLMKTINRLKKKYLAVLLSDIEREYRWVDTIRKDAAGIKQTLNDDGRIDTYKLKYLLDRIDTQLPSYYMTRKIVLDNVNEYVRNILQALLGDIEGYGQRRDS